MKHQICLVVGDIFQPDSFPNRYFGSSLDVLKMCREFVSPDAILFTYNPIIVLAILM
jgi:hypothetical protein